MKNIAIFLDGTWNATDDYTNVYNLYLLSQGQEINFAESGRLLERNVDQLRYYDRGVGTTLASPSWLGGAIGWGLKRNVAQAWQIVSRYYEPGDQIYLFGFSRGAYTARSLAGVLNRFGQLSLTDGESSSVKGMRALVADECDLSAPFLGVDLLRSRNSLSPEQFELAQIEFRKKHCVENGSASATEPVNSDGIDHGYSLPIKFVGIWDTVGALGIPWLFRPGEPGRRSERTGPQTKFQRLIMRHWMPDSIFPDNIQHAVHALAIDEHRPHFQPTLWRSPDALGSNNQPVNSELAGHVEQRWFTGAHSNIGGGYPDNRLNALPFEWIYNNAQSHGLKLGHFLYPQLYQPEPISALEPVIDSYSAFRFVYGLNSKFKRFYRTLSTIDCTQSLSPSVQYRLDVDRYYRPPNLMSAGTIALNKMMVRAHSSDNQCIDRIRKISSKNGETANG